MIKERAGNVAIFVLQRGWVVVGSWEKQGTDYVINKGAVIRRWGTTEGLPQLVNGPTEKTILDKSKTPIRFHELTCVLKMECLTGAWLRAL